MYAKSRKIMHEYQEIKTSFHEFFEYWYFLSRCLVKKVPCSSIPRVGMKWNITIHNVWQGVWKLVWSQEERENEWCHWSQDFFELYCIFVWCFKEQCGSKFSIIMCHNICYCSLSLMYRHTVNCFEHAQASKSSDTSTKCIFSLFKVWWEHTEGHTLSG